MRSRTLREGSVGLLILLGLATFGGIFLWLRGFSVGKNSYQAIIEFSDIAGMQEGAPVRYRGVQVGNISKIAPGSNGVEVTIDISPANLKIPRELLIEANQSGLIGETSIDIRPLNRVPIIAGTPNPLDPNCETQNFIVCNDTRLKGQIGVSLYDLLRNTTILAEAYSNPKFVANLNTTTQNAALAASEIAKLSREFTLLSGDLRRELRTFSTSANAIASSANVTATQATLTLAQVSRTANQFGNTANQASLTLTDVSNAANQFGGTANQFNLAAKELTITANKFGTTPDKLNETIARFGNTSDRVSSAIEQLGNTASNFNELAVSLNSLIAENRTALTSTLKNFDRTSQELSNTLATIRPTLTQFTTAFGQVNGGEIVKNLEILSANAAQTSANFRDLTASLKDPKNAVLLQQTLDSARSTMQNLQKITSDVDELTGDPAFRDNLKNLVNGLGKLVSSSEDLQRQIEVGQNLEKLNYQMKYTATKYPKFTPKISSKPTDSEPVE